PSIYTLSLHDALPIFYSADNQKTLIYAKGDKVAELKTDYGYAETDLLPLGKYRIYEKTAGDGFVINKEIKKVSLTYKDEHTSVVDRKSTRLNSSHVSI